MNNREGIAGHVADLRSLLDGNSMPNNVIAGSRAMLKLLNQSARFARTSATVLLTGESGTGKEVVARWIHNRSQRSHLPYVRVNCAALPDTLIESELFGYERGAFTGAVQSRRGLLAAAEDGTILLDEISEIPLAMQAKLLRVLEEEEFQPLGCDDVQHVRARVIASTNRCLQTAVREGEFREDLFYRLNVLQVKIPPLRSRPEDIRPLAEHFVTKFAGDMPDNFVSSISPVCMKSLQEFAWPGNVRQLRNVIQRACVVDEDGILTDDDIDFLEPVEETAEPADEVDFESLTLDSAERLLILRALHRHRGNKTAAARQLGVSPRTLTNKLKRYQDLGLSDAA